MAGERIPTPPGFIRTSIGGDPGAGGDRPSALAPAILSQPPPPRVNEFLSRLPPQSVTPFFWWGIGTYTNVAGTVTELVNVLLPAGRALVVTEIKPLFFVSNTQELVEVTNPWAMVLNVNGTPHRFNYIVDGGTVDEQTFRWNSSGTITDLTGITPAIPFTEPLAWNPGYYAAYVRGGGRFAVQSLILNAIAVGVGATIPDAVGIQIGGFKIPEDDLAKWVRVR